MCASIICSIEAAPSPSAWSSKRPWYGYGAGNPTGAGLRRDLDRRANCHRVEQNLDVLVCQRDAAVGGAPHRVEPGRVRDPRPGARQPGPARPRPVNADSAARIVDAQFLRARPVVGVRIRDAQEAVKTLAHQLGADHVAAFRRALVALPLFGPGRMSAKGGLEAAAHLGGT